jgi:hypothetical protein
MNWKRHTHPTGVPFYTNDESDEYMIEAEVYNSTFAGMVFGNWQNEAGREGRIVAWSVIRDERRVNKVKTLKDAKAYVERRMEAAIS